MTSRPWPPAPPPTRMAFRGSIQNRIPEKKETAPSHRDGAGSFLDYVLPANQLSPAFTSNTRVPQLRRPSVVWLAAAGMYSVANQMPLPLGSSVAHE